MPTDAAEDEGPEQPARRLRGVPAVKLHLTLAAGLALCVAAFWFELYRALGGNKLSWLYVFEWPIFAVFAVYMWWNLLHEPDRQRRRRRPPPAEPGGDRRAEEGQGDADLEAWQRYLKDLEAADSEHELPGRGDR